MVNAGALAIPLAFIILSAVLLWAIIGAKGKWWIKCLLIVLVPSFGIIVWQSFNSYFGWATKEKTPEQFQLLWVEIVEPNIQENDKGAIYVWVFPYGDSEKQNIITKVFGYKPKTVEPRAYKIPYSRNLHIEMEKAKEMLMGGVLVVVERNSGVPEEQKEQDDNQQGQEGGKNKNGKNEEGYESQVKDDQFKIYKLPPAKSPRKD